MIFRFVIRKNFLAEIKVFNYVLLKTGVPFAKTPQIPKLVLLGNEKSGKSSLLEKLFGSSVYIKDQKIDRPVHVETCHVDGMVLIPGSNWRI